MAQDKAYEAIDRARAAAAQLGLLDRAATDQALRAAADALLAHSGELLAANVVDVRGGERAGLAQGGLERLRLTEEGIAGLADGLRRVAELPDPVGEAWGDSPPGVGAQFSQIIRVPLGVVGVVCEAQPSVTVEATGSALKAGNSVLLRGTSAGANSDEALTGVLRDALAGAGLPRDVVQLMPSTERSSLRLLVTARGRVDLVLLCGGLGLVRSVLFEATVPVVELGFGNCHVYVDASADLSVAEQVVLGSRHSYARTSCAPVTVLMHADIAAEFVPMLVAALRRLDIVPHGDERVVRLAAEAVPATDRDWHHDYLPRDITLGVVDSANAAIVHVNRLGTGHTEVIVARDAAVARAFVTEVDAASVRVNAPIGVADADAREVGRLVSTQKLHVRGPIDPEVFTTTKSVTWIAG